MTAANNSIGNSQPDLTHPAGAYQQQEILSPYGFTLQPPVVLDKAFASQGSGNHDYLFMPPNSMQSSAMPTQQPDPTSGSLGESLACKDCKKQFADKDKLRCAGAHQL